MQYTCGYFPIGNESIDEAQVAKFELIRNRFENHRGSLVAKDHLDIGCGWGGLASYFSDNFKTRSVGNTNCHAQMEYAQRHFDCEIMLDDFSRLESTDRRFDLITIVGIIEHLTPSRRTHLLEVVRNLLHSDGLAYIQCIVKPSIWIGGDAYRIVQREVSPGHFLETHEQTVRRLEQSGFTVLDQSDGCHDYGLTTSRWVDNLQRNESALVALLGSRRYRMFVGYLAFASHMFLSGRGSLMRYTIEKRNR